MNNHTIGIALGVITFVSGLLLHILSRTKQIQPEKKRQVSLCAIFLMIVGGTMAMLPYMIKIAQQSPP